MASGTLYTYPENFRAFKVLIAAQYGGGNVKLAPDFVFGESNKTEWFRQKFPLGKVPAFESTDGKLLTESNAIAYFVSSPQLRGESDTEKAQVLQWLCFADSEIMPASCTWVFPCLSIMPFNKQATERAKEEVKGALTTLDKYLLTRTYLVSEHVTLADIGVACTLLHLYQYVLEPDFRQSYKNVNRWFTTIVNQPQAKAVLGDFKLCEKAAEYDPQKFAEFQAKAKGKKVSEGESEKGGAGKKNKKEKGAGSEKKEPKRAASPPPEDEMDDLTNEILAAEPKTKDPFDLLPKGTFIIDDFKRCYSNEEETKSIPYFWEKFDKENYSIWLGEYKYNDELKKVFMSCNLITGMFQRLDKMRKCAFASVCLFGSDNDSTISGIWVWRGQGLAFEMSADWQVDYESYQWTKLDADKAKTKELVAQYFAWQGTDKGGRKFNQGKIFK